MPFPGDRNIHHLFSTYYQLFYEGKKDDIAGQIFTDRLSVLIMKLTEMVINILDLSIDVDKTISSLIEKTNLLSKKSFIFSTSINIGSNKNCCFYQFLE